MRKLTYEEKMRMMLKVIAVQVVVLVVLLIVLCVICIVQNIEDSNNVSDIYEDDYIPKTKVTTSDTVEKEPSYTEEDVKLLARLIHGEARGECYEGQVAVGAIVLNRVKSKGFPNTLEGVIYQKRQFSCIDDGQFDLPIPENSSVYDAAREALEGNDPTNGCTYFYNPKISTSRWIFENTVTKVVI